MYAMCIQVTMETEKKNVGSPEVIVKKGCEPPIVGSRNRAQALEEQQVLLTDEPSLYPTKVFFKIIHH